MANTTIKHKANTTNAGAVPGAGVLSVGELALNTVDKVIYTKAANGTVVIIGTGADSQNVATQVTVGNSTVNTAITAGSIKLSNSTSNTTIAVPTSAQYTAGNYYLNANGSWVVVTGGSGSPTGSNTAIQFNDSGAFGGNLDFTWNKTTDQMALGNSTVTTTPSIKFQNSTVNTVISLPTSAQYAAGNYYLNANGSWVTVAGGGGGNTVFVRQNFTASAGQNTFTITSGYTAGQLDVYLNGIKLLVGSDVTASNGTGIQLTQNAANGDIVEVVGFANVTVTSSVGASADKNVLFNDGGSSANGSAAFTWTKTGNTLTLGTATTLDATERLRISDNSNNYVELQLKQANTGNNASSDLTFTSDSGTSTTNYLDVGINSSTYSQAAFASGPNDGYMYTQNSHLWISTQSANDIIFQTNGTVASSEVARFKSGGGLQLTGMSVPAAPSTNVAILFSKSIAGRQRIGQIGPSGIDYTFQPFIGANRIMWTNQVDNVALPTAINMAIANTLAFTARAMSTANLFLSTRRTGVAANTTAGTSAEARGSTRTHFFGNANNVGGFYAVFRAGRSVVAAQGRAFIGMSNSAAVLANANPSTFLNCLGFGYDSTQTTLRVFSGNATVAATPVDLGAGFPCSTGNTNLYDFHIFVKPNSATANYAVVNIDTGNVASGTFTSTNLPAVNTVLGWKVWVNNGSTAGIESVDLASVYLEMDNSG